MIEKNLRKMQILKFLELMQFNRVLNLPGKVATKELKLQLKHGTKNLLERQATQCNKNSLVTTEAMLMAFITLCINNNNCPQA